MHLIRNWYMGSVGIWYGVGRDLVCILYGVGRDVVMGLAGSW
jgi:hypothetical protein